MSEICNCERQQGEAGGECSETDGDDAHLESISIGLGGDSIACESLHAIFSGRTICEVCRGERGTLVNVATLILLLIWLGSLHHWCVHLVCILSLFSTDRGGESQSRLYQSLFVFWVWFKA